MATLTVLIVRLIGRPALLPPCHPCRGFLFLAFTQGLGQPAHTWARR